MNLKAKRRKVNPTKVEDPQLVAFNKPFQVLCQFTDQSPKQRTTLADFIDIPSIYAAGRLDYDSEGLLLLTNHGGLQHRISDPQHKLAKTYWVQVEGAIDGPALQQLRNGVQLNDGLTLPAHARRIDEPAIWPRTPSIRQRQHIPTTWLELVITEGRNRQVRRMTAAVGFPTLRLIRYAIGPWTLETLLPGQFRPLDAKAALQQLSIAPKQRVSGVIARK